MVTTTKPICCPVSECGLDRETIREILVYGHCWEDRTAAEAILDRCKFECEGCALWKK